VVLANPDEVAFGTAAQLAETAGVGIGSVHRLSVALGFSGFADLQAAARGEMSIRLQPAAAKIRALPADDVVNRAREVDLSNITKTFDRLDHAAVSRITKRLADPHRRVLVASGNSSHGVVMQFAAEIETLRDNVFLLECNPVSASAAVARAARRDILVVVDLHRYDAWLVDLVDQAADAGIEIWSVADSRLCPFATRAVHCFEVAADSPSPFDSLVGVLSLLSVLTAAVAHQLRDDATRRIDTVERAWQRGGHLRET